MSDFLKEFLVQIGFAVDERSAKQSEDRVQRVERTVSASEGRTTKARLREVLLRASADTNSFKKRVGYAEKLEEIDARFGGLMLRRTLRQAAAQATSDKDRIKWLGQLREAESRHHQRTTVNLQRAAGAALATAAVIQGATLAITAFAQKAAEKLEALAYSSDRTKSSVLSLKTFSQAVSQLGGTAGGALNDLENFAARLRQNPQGYAAFLKSVGVEARDAKGNIRGAADLYKEFRKNVAERKPYEEQLLYAQEMGVSEETWRATDPVKLAEQEAKARARYARMGHDPDKAAQDAIKLQNTFRDMWETIGVIGEKALSKVFGDVGDNLRGFTTFLEQHGDQIAEILSKVAQIVLAISKALVEIATSEKVKSFLDWMLGALGKVDDATGKWVANTERIKTGLEALAAFVALGFVAKITAGVTAAARALAPLLAVLGPLLGIPASALAALGIGAAVQTGGAIGKGGLSAGVDPLTGMGPGDPVGSGLTEPGQEGWLGKKIKSAWNGTKRALGFGGSEGSAGGGDAPQGDGKGTKGAAATGDMMRYAMDQLRREGVPEANLRQAAAHLVGQAKMESGLNPNQVHDGGTGYGIYGARDPKGWGNYKGARRSDMVRWLQANGYAKNSAEGQMREMAHQAMSGKYPRTRRILMGNGSGNVTADTNTITGEFESPAVINQRSGAVQHAMRTGPSEGPKAAAAPSKTVAPPAAPLEVAKPEGSAVARAPKPTESLFNQPLPGSELSPPKPAESLFNKPLPGKGALMDLEKGADRVRDMARGLNMEKVQLVASATQSFDPDRFFTVPPAGTESTTNNSTRHQSFKGGDTHITLNNHGNAADGSEIIKRHKDRQMADETRYAANVFA